MRAYGKAGVRMGWKSPTQGLGDPELTSRLGLRNSRLRRFSMTTLQPCLHSSFTIVTYSERRRLWLAAYRLAAGPPLALPLHSDACPEPVEGFDDQSLAVG